MSLVQRRLSSWGLLFAAAMIFRLLLLTAWYQSGQGTHLSADSVIYESIGQSLANDQGFSMAGHPTTRRVPVYPWALSVAIRFGVFPIGVQLLQVLAGSLTCLILVLIGRAFFSQRTAFVAGWILAFDYLLAKQCVYILPEILFILFFLTSLYFILRSRQFFSFRDFAIGGFFAALTVLTKEVMSLFYIGLLMILFLSTQRKKRCLGVAFIFLLAYIGGLMPWVIRNTQVQGQLSSLTGSSGLTFFLGNNPSVSRRLHGGDWIAGVDTDYPSDEQSPTTISAIEVDQEYFRLAIEFIQNNPQTFLGNSMIKILRLWYPFYSKTSLELKVITGSLYGMTLLLMLAGMYLSRKQWVELLPFYSLIAYLTLIHAVTIPGIRYRYPLMPFVILFSAVALERIYCHYGVKKGKMKPLQPQVQGDV